MDFNDWVADPAAGKAVHSSGFMLQIEGNPRDPSSVDPGKFPAELNFVEQARLLRCGLEFLAKAASSAGSETSWISTNRASEVKSAAVKEREAQAKRFAENPDKPKRSVLSLKKPQ
jgi:hypothetical protein